MRHFKRFGYLLVLTSLLGCEARQGSEAEPQTAIEVGKEDKPTVGLVNYQEILAVLGIDSQLVERREKLQAEFNRVANETRREMVEKIKEFGNDFDAMSAEQQEEMSQLERSRRDRLAQLERENNREMQEATQWLERVFRQKTKGPIEEIAKSRGLSLVLFPSPGQVAYFEPGVDITAAVVERLNYTMSQERPVDDEKRADEQVAPSEPTKPSEE